MIDFETLVVSLQNHGFNVERTIKTPRDAGDAELVIDGQLVTVEAARQMLVDAQHRSAYAPPR